MNATATMVDQIRPPVAHDNRDTIRAFREGVGDLKKDLKNIIRTPDAVNDSPLDVASSDAIPNSHINKPPYSGNPVHAKPYEANPAWQEQKTREQGEGSHAISDKIKWLIELMKNVIKAIIKFIRGAAAMIAGWAAPRGTPQEKKNDVVASHPKSVMQKFSGKDEAANDENMEKIDEITELGVKSLLDVIEKQTESPETAQILMALQTGEKTIQEAIDMLMNNSTETLLARVDELKGRFEAELDDLLKDEIPDSVLRKAAIAEITQQLPNVSIQNHSTITSPVVQEKILSYVREKSTEAQLFGAMKMTLAGMQDAARHGEFNLREKESVESVNIPAFLRKTPAPFPGIQKAQGLGDFQDIDVNDPENQEYVKRQSMARPQG